MKLAVALCVMCWLVQPARADRADQVRADQLFKKGKKLLADKRYADACTAFEDSDRLDPGIGAKLNIAKCYEEWGKLATAWKWYSEAEGMASRGKDDRAKKIRTLVDGLDASVPRLTLVLPPDANLTGVVIQLDGVELAASAIGNPQRVDPGPHQVDVIVAGVKQTRAVRVDRGERPEITLEVPRKTRPGPKSEPRKPVAEAAAEAAPDPVRKRRLLGMGIAGGGGFLVIVATVVTLRARSDYNYSLSTHCFGQTNMCDDRGLEVTHGARSRANISTALTLVGLGAVGTGLYFYLTAPRALGGEHALYVAPQADGTATGIVLGGSF